MRRFGAFLSASLQKKRVFGRQDDMTKETLLTVFGGAGLVGRYTVRALAKAGYRLRVGVRRPSIAGYLTSMGHVGQIQLCKVDVRNEDVVRAALRDAQGAINLTGALYARGQSFDDIHVTAAAMIAKHARAEGTQSFVHVSAIGADVGSESDYARTKGEGELAVRESFPKHQSCGPPRFSARRTSSSISSQHSRAIALPCPFPAAVTQDCSRCLRATLQPLFRNVSKTLRHGDRRMNWAAPVLIHSAR